MAWNVIDAGELPENVDNYLRGLYPEQVVSISPSATVPFGSTFGGMTAICAVFLFALVAGQTVLGL
jgi:hypothetical protein